MARSAAITIDVDSLRFYRAIHGLPPIPPEDDPIYTIAMPRFWSLLDDQGVCATLFLVGEDAAAHPSAFTDVISSGSEVASHSHQHDYRLSIRDPQVIERDLANADAALVPLNGGRPIAGFRAPGYNVSPVLLQACLRLGYRYDSSLLPSPQYWLARWSVIRAYRALGRRSASLPGTARQFAGPLEPYRTTTTCPWRPDDAGALFELPMACDPTTRIPLFGTSWVMAPRAVQWAMLKNATRKLDCIVFEMHAIDLLDQTDAPALAELAPHQRDLAVGATDKLAAFRRLFGALRDDAEILTLADIAPD